MPFTLPDLPFDPHAFRPVLTMDSFSGHHQSHHGGVVNGSNEIIAGEPALQNKSLEEVIKLAAADPAKKKLLFNASQHWNHSLYWLSLATPGSSKPSPAVERLIARSFGDMAGFKAAFIDAAIGLYGSGWIWLVVSGETLSIEATSNADLPLLRDQHALITCDVWEHTYYIDYRNNRKTFATDFVDKLLNWDTVEERWEVRAGSLDKGYH
jgi:Fe-Mn family superoxide dismutase